MSEAVSPSYPAIPAPQADVNALLATTIALRIAVETLTRQRGTSESWAATVLELASETGNGGQPAVSVSYLKGLVDQATMLVGSVSQQMGGKLDRSGGIMSGPLTLVGNPSSPMEAATKSYVDANAGGGVTWNNLPGRPEAFPPKPHQHTINDIIQLQVELDQRALLVHRHAYTDLDAPEGVTPEVGHVLTWTPQGIALLAPKTGPQGVNLWIAEAPPLFPQTYPFWFDTNAGHLFLFYDDGSSGQWVPSAPLVPGPAGPRGAATLNGGRPPLPSDGRDADFWIDTSNFVIYGPKLNGQWPMGVSMRTGGKALTMGGERVQFNGFNLELS